MSEQHRGPIIDFERCACLCDAGQHDYFAAVAVDRDGKDELWLVSIDALNRDGADHGDPEPDHERLGRLPRRIHDRIWPPKTSGPRCGRRTKTGRPCRNFVDEPGTACMFHREKAQR